MSTASRLCCSVDVMTAWRCVYLLHNLSAAPSLSPTSVSVGKLLTVITLVGAGRMDSLSVQDLILHSHGVPFDRWSSFIALSRMFPENCLHLDKALECQMFVCVSVCVIDMFIRMCVTLQWLLIKASPLFIFNLDTCFTQSVMKLWFTTSYEEQLIILNSKAFFFLLVARFMV